MFIKKNRIFIASFIVFFFISNTSATELKIAITQYPPHVNVINGQIKGPVFQYLNNIFNTILSILLLYQCQAEEL